MGWDRTQKAQERRELAELSQYELGKLNRKRGEELLQWNRAETEGNEDMEQNRAEQYGTEQKAIKQSKTEHVMSGRNGTEQNGMEQILIKWRKPEQIELNIETQMEQSRNGIKVKVREKRTSAETTQRDKMK